MQILHVQQKTFKDNMIYSVKLDEMNVKLILRFTNFVGSLDFVFRILRNVYDRKLVQNQLPI